MKFGAVVICAILTISIASEVSTSSLSSLENEKKCGTYTSDCESSPFFSTSGSLIFSGEMYKDPSTLVLTQSMYAKDQCINQYLFLTTQINMSAKVIDSSVHNAVKYEDVLFSLSEIAAPVYSCTPEVKPNQYYSIMTHVCIDQQGNDPFEKLRNIVGKTVESTIEYNENTVMFEYGNTTLYTRVNDEGCTAIPTTLPPTLPPTEPTTLPPTLPPTEPTTLPPTLPPTTQPPTLPPTEPTTLPPTTQPPTQPPTEPTTLPPTTQPPTQPPTTQPPTQPPTTQPPTQPPTTQPPTTQPPTVPPTEAPKPHHNYTVWFIVGAVCIVIGFTIIFVIVCKKNKQAADTDETKPLV